MLNLVKRAGRSAFFRGTAIVFVATGFANLLNFFYNLSMGRLLGPEKYGELGALLSLFSFLGVVQVVVNLYTVKTVSTYTGRGTAGLILAFQKGLTTWMFAAGFALLTLVVLLSNNLSNFLMLSDVRAYIVIGLTSVFSLPITLNRGILQGMLAFASLGAVTVAEMLVKLILSILFVLAGFAVFGQALQGGA